MGIEIECKVSKFEAGWVLGISLKRFDQIVLGCIFLLTLLVALAWGFGAPHSGSLRDRTPNSVQHFSWEGKRISAMDKFFSLSFSQAIDPEFVSQHFSIEPPLPGKLSWVGKRFFYTLSDLPIYGQDYQVKIATTENTPVEPFLSRFKTRDRAFAYIGTEGTDRGRLILYNLTLQEKSLLTPADLIVLSFDVYPEGDRLLFSAIPRGAANTTIGDQQLYTVTTGFNYAGEPEEAIAAGQIRRILDAEKYTNGKFQLADNGRRIVIQRTNREDPRDRSLWVISGQAEPRALGIPADEFLLSPDAEIMAIAQQNKLSLVPLGRDGGAIRAKEEYSKLLAFSPDQTQQIALQTVDGINSIYVLKDQAEDRVLLRTLTPILECRFEPRRAEMLYCLKIDENESLGQKIEEPFLSAINLATGEETPLLALPNYRDVRLSVAADGLALIFDQVVTANPTRNSDLFTENGLAVEGGRLWLLTLPELGTGSNIQPSPPDALMPGYKPQWIP